MSAMRTAGAAEAAYLDGKANLTAEGRADFYHYLAFSIALDIDKNIEITAEVYAENCRTARASALGYAAEAAARRAAS